MNTRSHEAGAARMARSSWPYLRRVAVVLITGALVVVIYSAVRPGTAAPDYTRSTGIPVDVTVARHLEAYETTRDFTGEVRARRSSDIGFELAGRIVELAVDAGDAVVAGQMLARLDTSRLVVERQRLLARRAEAEAVLNQHIAGPRAQTIATARAVVDERQSDVGLLRRKSRKFSRLFEQGRASEEEFDDARSAELAAEARLEQARQQLEELLVGTRQELIDAQRAVVDQLDAAIAAVEVDLQRSALSSPFDGRISQRVVDEGTVVPAGQPVLRVVETEALEARFGISTDTRATLPIGTALTLRVAGREVPATVWRHLPEVDPLTRTATIVVRIDADASGALRPGQIVRLPVVRRIERAGLWLPLTALVRAERGLWSCYVLDVDERSDQTRARRVVVEVLHTEAERCYVRGLVDDGDRVISGGVQKIVPGQLVEPLSAARGG